MKIFTNEALRRVDEEAYRRLALLRRRGNDLQERTFEAQQLLSASNQERRTLQSQLDEALERLLTIELLLKGLGYDVVEKPARAAFTTLKKTKEL